jgi:uncharacterized protein (TIGR02569 family)
VRESPLHVARRGDTTFRSPPPKEVLAAFGVSGPPTALSGGRGLTWRAGKIVIKPADASEEMLAWQARVLADVDPDEVRVAGPIPSLGGAFIVDDWSASILCAGRHEPGRWSDIIAVGRRYHRALAHVHRSPLMASQTGPWAVADRAAWGEVPLDPYRRAPHVARLEGCLRAVRAPSQVIHGDLTGNVLFADPLPPAVIDLSAYWRPVEYASAIVVADALAWEGADAAELESTLAIDGFGQFLARALLFRIITDVEADPDSMDARAAAYAPAVDLAVRFARDDT